MKFRIGIHPAFWLVLMVGFFTETMFRMLGVYLCLIIHEAGHGFVAHSLKAKISYIRIMPFGIAMRISGKLSNRKSLIISLAGPIFSIIAGLLFENKFLRYSNLALGIFNLLPVKGLDGGKIFDIILTKAAGSIRSCQIIKVTSAVISALLFVLGGYAAFITGFNISLILVSVFLIYSLISGNDYNRISAHLTAVDYRKTKSRHGIYPVKHIAIPENMPLRRILPELSPGKLCIINILDDKHRIVSTVSEQSAVDIMLTHGANASFASAQKGEFK